MKSMHSVAQRKLIRKTQQGEINRRGMSLLEVVIGVAIFLGGMTAIYSLVSTGADASIRAQLQNEAIIHAETKMGEVIGGLFPLENVDAKPVEVDEFSSEGWFWNMNVVAVGDDDYTPLRIEVTVYHEGQQGDPNASFTVYRTIRDPQLFVDAAVAAEEAAAGEDEE